MQKIDEKKYIWTHEKINIFVLTSLQNEKLLEKRSDPNFYQLFLSQTFNNDHRKLHKNTIGLNTKVCTTKPSERAKRVIEYSCNIFNRQTFNNRHAQFLKMALDSS